MVAVMVPDHDLDVAQLGSGQRWPQVIPYKIPLFFSTVEATVPGLGGFGLVLNR